MFSIPKFLSVLGRQQVSLGMTTVLSPSLTAKRSMSGKGVKLLKLNEMSNNPGAVRKRIRWGRGTGSGRGKMCGYGHQKSRATPRGFEGGQTPLYKTQPKIGFYNHGRQDFQPLNLNKLKDWILMKRLVPKEGDLITARDLLKSGIISSAKEGIKLLARGQENFDFPIHLEVSSASDAAVRAIEAAGGTVTSTHFNRLALRALTKPWKFDILPNRARPPPKLIPFYMDRRKAGYMNPEIQIRNLKLFGKITSEDPLREEHLKLMEKRRREKRELMAARKAAKDAHNAKCEAGRLKKKQQQESE